LLLERNKHLLLKLKSTTGIWSSAILPIHLLTTDDEKKIRKAIKESKQLGEGKKRAASCKVPRAKGVIPCSSERRAIHESRIVSYARPLVAGKQSQPCDEWSACFRCFKPGTTMLQMSRVEQELLSSPQAAIDKQNI